MFLWLVFCYAVIGFYCVLIGLWVGTMRSQVAQRRNVLSLVRA